MAIICDYEEEPPATTTRTDASKKPRLDIPPYDKTLDRLLQQHKNEPFSLLETVADFLFRRIDALSTDQTLESRASQIFSSAKRKARSALEENRTSKKTQVAEQSKSAQAADESKKAPKEEPKKDQLPENKTSTDESFSKAAVEKVEQDESFSKAAVEKVEQDKKESLEEQTGSAKEEDDDGKGLKPNAGNGADHEKYSWTQTLAEASIQIPLPPGTKARGITSEIKKKQLTAGLKGQPPVLKGELYAPVITDDCFWSIEDGKTLSILLTKANKMECWNCVVKGEPTINTQKVGPEISKLSDLDPETRQTLEKRMFDHGFQFDQRQKAMGLSTSEEQQKNEILKKFMA